ncbi:MAG: glycosyltransferase [Parcubacteria group bacterium Greene0714_7]|nr:MAG: glycosyltransferase [Parcubacteria group bacterium Greene0714_7]
MSTSSTVNNDRRDDAKIHNGVKRVLIFSLAYYPKYIGGAEVAIKEITDRILPADIEFHMVTLRFDSALPKVEQVGNVLVHRIGFAVQNPSMVDLKKFPLALNKFLFQGLAPLYALGLHKKYNYDGIWGMMAHSVGIAIGIFKFLKPRVKYVLTLQEGDPPKYIERLALPAWPLFRYAFTSADRVQVISTFLGTWAKRMGYAGEPIVIPNGVNTVAFSKEVPEQELIVLKEKLQKKKDDVFLITASRLVHKNAIDDVISSLSFLPENIKFLILGTGPDEEKLKLEARTYNLEARVLFLGHVTHEDLPKYLKVSDIFIRPSRSEGMGNSFIEAFASGIPVIATQEGGIADFLFDVVHNPEQAPTGFVVDADNPKQIAETVNNIVEHPEVVTLVVQNAQALAQKGYDWNLIAKDMKEKVFSLF